MWWRFTAGAGTVHLSLLARTTIWLPTTRTIRFRQVSQVSLIANDTTGCVWTATTCPSPRLQGDLGNNTYNNNIFVNNGNAGTGLIYARTLANRIRQLCLAHVNLLHNGQAENASYFQGKYSVPYLFNTADTYLSTSTFSNNLFFKNGTYADSNVIGWGLSEQQHRRASTRAIAKLWDMGTTL